MVVRFCRHVTGGVVVTSALHHNHSDLTLAGNTISTCRGVILQLNHNDANDDYVSALR